MRLTAGLAALVVVVAVGAPALAGDTTTTTTTTTTTSTTVPARKVFVCKYTGTPGIDEQLQGGGNPISIDWQPGRDPGQFFNDAQGRSYVIAFDVGQPEPDVSECPPPSGGTTTTSTTSTTTTPPTSSTTTVTTTTCPDCTPNTQGNTTTTTTPTTSTTTASSTPTTSGLPTTTSTVSGTTTSTTAPATTTSSTSPTTTGPSTTSTSSTLPTILDIGAASVVCSRDVPYVVLTFGNQPEFDGLVGTVTFVDVNGNVIESHAVTYQAGGTVTLLYPGASVDAQGNATDWPGWQLNADGFWVLDPSDAVWREGLTIVAEINPTATTTVSYPPATSACDSPAGPFPPPTFELPATR